MAETSVVNKIAIATAAEAAHPTIPAKGSNVASWGSWVTIGSIGQFTDDADLDDSAVKQSEKRNDYTIHPPLSMEPENGGVINEYVDSIAFICYDASEALLTLDSNMSMVSHVGSRTATNTRRSVCVEINGRRLDYYPNCDVEMVTEPGSIKEPMKTSVTIRPYKGATGAACQRHWYQA